VQCQATSTQHARHQAGCGLPEPCFDAPDVTGSRPVVLPSAVRVVSVLPGRGLGLGWGLALCCPGGRIRHLPCESFAGPQRHPPCNQTTTLVFHCCWTATHGQRVACPPPGRCGSCRCHAQSVPGYLSPVTATTADSPGPQTSLFYWLSSQPWASGCVLSDGGLLPPDWQDSAAGHSGMHHPAGLSAGSAT